MREKVAVIVADDVKQVRSDGCGVEQALAVSKRGDKRKAHACHRCQHDIWPLIWRLEPARAVRQCKAACARGHGQFQLLFASHVKK